MLPKLEPKLFFLMLALLSCNKYAATNHVYKRRARELAKNIKRPPRDAYFTSDRWVGTTNFGLRRPDMVIIHHTAENSCPETLGTFTDPASQVSAHYVICRDGTVYHMLSDYLRAWQAGVSSWGNNRDVNSCSIGIELDNNGYESFPPAQINSLLVLLDTLKTKYRIPAANFVGHSDIAPTRKKDPNVNFPWELLARNGYGLWYGDTSQVSLPDHFNDLEALRIIGYSLKDTAAAIVAFKRHFETQDSSAVLSPADEKILYDLMQKYE